MVRETLSKEQRYARIKAAILEAADFIEGHPQSWNFSEVDVPRTCESPGCALGWIHHFSKVRGVRYAPSAYLIDAPKIFGPGHTDDWFYAQMDRLKGSHRWRDDPRICARALRLFAERYPGVLHEQS